MLCMQLHIALYTLLTMCPDFDVNQQMGRISTVGLEKYQKFFLIYLPRRNLILKFTRSLEGKIIVTTSRSAFFQRCQGFFLIFNSTAFISLAFNVINSVNISQVTSTRKSLFQTSQKFCPNVKHEIDFTKHLPRQLFLTFLNRFSSHYQ